jgi:hypothetical protein
MKLIIHPKLNTTNPSERTRAGREKKQKQADALTYDSIIFVISVFSPTYPYQRYTSSQGYNYSKLSHCITSTDTAAMIATWCLG